MKEDSLSPLPKLEVTKAPAEQPQEGAEKTEKTETTVEAKETPDKHKGKRVRVLSNHKHNVGDQSQSVDDQYWSPKVRSIPSVRWVEFVPTTTLTYTWTHRKRRAVTDVTFHIEINWLIVISTGSGIVVMQTIMKPSCAETPQATSDGQ